MRNIIDIANIIEKNGGRLYLVGGAVRDKLMNKPPHDEDYCVTGISSEKFEKLFPESFKRGKVFGNLMVDVQPTNEKLKMRAVSIVCQSVDCDEAEATRLLNKSKFNVKIAILMGLTGKDEIECQEALEKNKGNISLTVRSFL